MIEFYSKGIRGTLAKPILHDWKRLPKTVKMSALNFDIFKIRIEGVVYTYKSPEFKEAFEKARIWEML